MHAQMRTNGLYYGSALELGPPIPMDLVPAKERTHVHVGRRFGAILETVQCAMLQCILLWYGRNPGTIEIPCL